MSGGFQLSLNLRCSSDIMPPILYRNKTGSVPYLLVRKSLMMPQWLSYDKGIFTLAFTPNQISLSETRIPAYFVAEVVYCSKYFLREIFLRHLYMNYIEKTIGKLCETNFRNNEFYHPPICTYLLSNVDPIIFKRVGCCWCFC